MMGRKVFDEAPSALRRCPAGLHPTLKSIPYQHDLGMWFISLPVDDPYRPKCNMTCIRSISLELRMKSFDASLLNYLRRRFALFLALEYIEIWTMSERLTSRSSKPDSHWPSSQPRKIAEDLKQTCGMVRRLSMVSGIERAQHLWDEGLSRYQYISSVRNI
ncbi:hypothetical protein BJ165DRAFT_1114899 [Panaeolus papilionaceus]|nr:hypothetical protein BJ165DRAFT_1114899 [Panaeolus papilionaceus]